MTSIIVTERRNGASVFRSVWVADSEQDFISRVIADASRSDFASEHNNHTVEGCVRHLESCYAESVQLITREVFGEIKVDSWHELILAKARELGWTAWQVVDVIAGEIEAEYDTETEANDALATVLGDVWDYQVVEVHK